MTLFAMLITALTTSSAQTANTAAQKKVYQTTLGGLTGGTVAPERLKTVIDSALAVRDERRKAYPVTGFRISYLFNSRFEDEETGLVTTKRALRTRDFDSDRLDPDWAASIRDNTRKGDELIFSRVMVRLPNGRKTFVPDLRIKVE